MTDASSRDEFLAQLEGFRLSLLRAVEFRIHPAVRARFDAADVVQEAFLEVDRRLDSYMEKPDMAFFPWVRFLTIQKLKQFHRHHLGVQKRDAFKDVGGLGAPVSTMQSRILSGILVDNGTSPSGVVSRNEEIERLRKTIETMSDQDREILGLRYYEQVENNVIAEVLGITESAASRRLFRALGRLRELMGGPTSSR